jgi:hypothetical protein
MALRGRSAFAGQPSPCRSEPVRLRGTPSCSSSFGLHCAVVLIHANALLASSHGAPQAPVPPVGYHAGHDEAVGAFAQGPAEMANVAEQSSGRQAPARAARRQSSGPRWLARCLAPMKPHSLTGPPASPPWARSSPPTRRNGSVAQLSPGGRIPARRARPVAMASSASRAVGLHLPRQAAALWGPESSGQALFTTTVRPSPKGQRPHRSRCVPNRRGPCRGRLDEILL